MLSSTENPSYITSLAENLSKTVPSHLTPLSPEKYINIERKEYTADQLMDMTETELIEAGINEEEILATIGVPEGVLVKTEKRLVETETAMEWATNYWDALNKSFENRLRNGADKSKVMYADIRLRALGVSRFLDALSDYTNGDTYAYVRDVLTTACDLYILAESDTGNLNIDDFERSRAMGRAVNLALSDPAKVDAAIELGKSGNFKKIGLEADYMSKVEGVKAECLAAMIITQYEYPEIGYDITFKKPPAFQDVRNGTDFILTINENRYSKDLAYFDVKKALSVNDEGSCRVVVEDNTAVIYEGDNPSPLKKELYGIEDFFISNIKNKNVTGIIVRLPRNLIENCTLSELSELDNGSNSDYNEAKSHVFREIGIVFERIGN